MREDKTEDYEHNEDLARVLMVRNSDTLNTALLYLRQYKKQICKEQREIWIKSVDEKPKKYKMVIINFKGKLSRIKGKVTEGYWNGEYWDCYALLSGINEEITVDKWMYLPSV